MSKVKDAVPAPAGAAGKGKPEELDPEFMGLMSEIENDLRTDEFRKLWKRYGSLFITFAVLLVVGVTGVVMYRDYETRQREAAARRYELAVSAQQDGKTDEALSAFTALEKDGGKAYSMLARFNVASLQVLKKDIDGAIATYKALADDQTVDPAYRDLATLMRVLHSLDREDPKVLEAALTPLTGPNNAFNPSALELTALLAAKQGDTARAVKTLALISADPTTPATMRERAEDLSKLYQAGVVPPPPAMPAVVGPAAAPAPEPNAAAPVTPSVVAPSAAPPAPSKP